MKLIRRMLLCVLLATVACVCVGCSVYREPVALLLGIEFGMSPGEATAVLGEPSEEKTITGMNGVTYKTFYYENVQVSGFYAQIQLKFGTHGFGTVLEKCTITFDRKIGDCNLAVGLYQWVIPVQWHAELDELLSAQLCGENGFVRMEKTESSIVYEQSRGAVGTTYSLQMTDDGRDVQLLAECDEYYR